MTRYFFLFCLIGLASCERKRHEPRSLFRELSADETGIIFSNRLTESEDFNIIEYLYFYNGGGVAIGDINNDGLQDIFLSANQEDNKLYLNKGDFSFEDITKRSRTAGVGNWKTGVSMADVNADGWLDIFVCGVGNYKKFNGRNQLLINNGDLTFTDRTEMFGLSFSGFSTQGVFFDFDNDGDLDLYLLNHSVHSTRTQGNAYLRHGTDPSAGDKLYKNEFAQTGRHYFSEVTNMAGIFNSAIGYGLGVGLSDINSDGFTDIYVSNDFQENDYLYINRADGRFAERLTSSMPHTSRFSMGNDIADINNDLLPDVITLDMLPNDESVIKTSAGDDPYDIYQFKLKYGYHHQVARNTLQLNLGTENDSTVIFSDVALMAKVFSTDWSWSPLLADFDNDGFKDLFVTNGIQRRPNNLDYISFIASDSVQHYLSSKELIEHMPPGTVPNYVFRNNHDLTFSDSTAAWLNPRANVSNGAAYADLDNDGDLDLVVNNLNETASVFKNNASNRGSFLRLNLHGAMANRSGIGVKAIAKTANGEMFLENFPSKGFQSCSESALHFGLGSARLVDSLIIVWPGGKAQVKTKVKASQALEVFEDSATLQLLPAFYLGKRRPLLRKIQVATPLRHKENSFVAFNVEKLSPRTYDQQGPALAATDVNGDGLDDLFVGSASGKRSKLFLQTKAGFAEWAQPDIEKDSAAEDVVSIFFDANGDNKPDLLVAGGGQQYNRSATELRPRLYINKGAAGFHKSMKSIPELSLNASCISTSDIDHDGDMDIFIGANIEPARYGVSPMSCVLVNNGYGVFSDQSSKWLPTDRLGMVSDASFADINGDGREDLVVVGEWMPVTILVNNSNSFVDATEKFGLSGTTGLWTSVMTSDVDQDGDVDVIGGNLGLNSRLTASPEQPLSLYVSDIDKNGSIDPVLCYYHNGTEHPFISRDQLIKQVPALKKRFLKYESYKNARIGDIVNFEDKTMVVKRARMLASSLFLNERNQSFQIEPLPKEVQVFPIFSMAIAHLDRGQSTLFAVGNLYEVQPDIGRYDAGYGVLMEIRTGGKITAISPAESGFVVHGQGRDVLPIRTLNGHQFIAVGINNENIVLFKKQ